MILTFHCSQSAVPLLTASDAEPFRLLAGVLLADTKITSSSSVSSCFLHRRWALLKGDSVSKTDGVIGGGVRKTKPAPLNRTQDVCRCRINWGTQHKHLEGFEVRIPFVEIHHDLTGSCSNRLVSSELIPDDPAWAEYELIPLAVPPGRGPRWVRRTGAQSCFRVATGSWTVYYSAERCSRNKSRVGEMSYSRNL